MAFANAHALIIGVGSYAHEPSLDVPITAKDAAAVAELLADPRFCGYDTANVKLLRDGETTRAALLAAFDALAQRTDAESTVFVFYCGHGDLGEDGQFYLTTHDSRYGTTKLAPGSGIAAAELIAKVQAIPARSMTLIFNACHSGHISPESLGPSETTRSTEPPAGLNLPEDVRAALLASAGRVVITACRDGQKSYFKSSLPHTFFTQALLDGLRGVDLVPRGRFISLFDLYPYLYERVQHVISQHYGAFGYRQEPELTVSKGIGPLALALYHGAEAAPAESAEITRDLEPALQAEELGGAVNAIEPADAERAYRYLLVKGAYVQGNYTDSRGTVTITGGTFNNSTITGYAEQLTINQIPPQQPRDLAAAALAETTRLLADAQSRQDYDLEDALSALQTTLKRIQSNPDDTAQRERARKQLTPLPEPAQRILAPLLSA